jgi:hypothetical protein
MSKFYYFNKVAKYDGDANKKYLKSLGVDGFPKIVFFAAGNKDVKAFETF